MFRDYDPYERRNGRSPHITNIPGPTRQQTVNPAHEINRLRQLFEQATTETAEWQQAAKKYYAIAQQQQAELAQIEQRLVSLQKEISRRDAEAQREKESFSQAIEAQTKKSVQPFDKLRASSAKSVDKTEENEWQEKYTRLYAEFENSKKRLEQRYALEAQQNQEKLLRDMLPLADNLERAILHAAADPSGLEMIQKAFLTVLAKYGVEVMDVAERPFNPEQHEALGTIPVANATPGTIATVAENGYTYQGNLLRPAKVLVAQ